jgi:thiol-disulfide isomerase/thioredoxin
MVDWDRVRELRSDGKGWDEIARDPEVGFHPEASVTEPGRALRALYHRAQARQARQGPSSAPRKAPAIERERRWTLLRAGHLAVPVLGVWFALAFVAPSPVGLLVPAIPYLALVLAGAAVVLGYALWKTQGRRWMPVFRSTVIGGIILGLVFAGMVGLVGALVFGCPYLPPASALSSEPAPGWISGNLGPWTEDGKPVLYYFGSTWCPYCSASSWPVWKALTEFGVVTFSGSNTSYSSASDVYARTPEVVLANASLASSSIAFQVSEYTGGTEGVAPTTSSCFQYAYVTAYSGGAIPFVAIDGKYVHGGATLISPATLSNYTATGASLVMNSVRSESGAPWAAVEDQAWWIMAMLAKSCGESVSVLANATTPHWSTATRDAVATDLAEL